MLTIIDELSNEVLSDPKVKEYIDKRFEVVNACLAQIVYELSIQIIRKALNYHGDETV